MARQAPGMLDLRSQVLERWAMSDSADDIVTAGMLVIGDEILSGRTKDRNISTLAEHLTAIGIDLKEVRIVGDDEGAIVQAVRAMSARYTYLFTTGGIGPTHDDITVDAVGKAFGATVDVDPRALAILKAAYEKRGLELTAPRLRMARLPAGSVLIDNSVSAAPGFMLGNVIVMAGVPAIMRAMLNAATQHLRTGSKVNAVWMALDVPEADIAEVFASHQALYPDVAMGSYPSFSEGKYRTELVLRGRDAARVEQAFSELAVKVQRWAQKVNLP
jgi:molybdenum cofactor synthesis domain-containing protein